MTASDDRISAFLDGELPPWTEASVERDLAADPGLRQRLDAFRQADAGVARIMADVLAEPVPLSLLRAVTPRPSRGRAPALVLGGALAGALAASVALIALRPPPTAPSWTAEIAAYHRLYSREGRHLVEVGAEEADHIRDWLGARIGRPFDIPDLGAFGLTFRGARLLVAAGEPVAQLVYTLDDGSVFALCLTQRPGAPDMAPVAERLDEFDSVVWRAGGTAKIFLGPAGRLPILDVARQAAAAI
jgi:anti-sigma factor RsiW